MTGKQFLPNTLKDWIYIGVIAFGVAGGYYKLDGRATANASGVLSNATTFKNYEQDQKIERKEIDEKFQNEIDKLKEASYLIIGNQNAQSIRYENLDQNIKNALEELKRRTQKLEDKVD